MSDPDAPASRLDGPYTAEVRLKGHRVGWLDALLDDFGTYRLRFDPEWINASDRHVLGQWFEDHLPSPIDFDGGLPLWFQELLPQGRLREYVANRHGLHVHDEFELLLALGEDLPGAVQLHESSESQLPRRATAAVGRRSDRAPAEDTLSVRYSLAGFQWKQSLRADERGLVVPARGERGDWIAKFEDWNHPNLPALEAATIGWACAAEIICAETRLGHVDEIVNLSPDFPTGNGSVLLSRRFDRDPWTHMEDFSQILGRADQFRGTAEELGVVVAALCPPADARELVRRLVFCVLCGNGDAHLKNWSLTYPDGRGARLSPAYDLVPTCLLLRRQALMLPVGGERAFSAITTEHFRPLAVVMGVSFDAMRQDVREAAAAIRAAWARGRAAFSPLHREQLEAHLADCRL